MTLRPAESSADLAALVALAETMHAESTFAALNFDRPVFAETLLRLTVDNPDGLALLARDDRGHPVGGLAAMVTDSFFGRDRVASELGLFVAPDRRGGLAAVRLTRRYIAWARSRPGVKRINVGNSAGTDDARYVKLMERLGFARAGSLMFMEV